MDRIVSKIVPIIRLTIQDKSEMYSLFEQYYIDINFEQFLSDLSEKTHVFTFRSNNQLIGFSTIFRKRIPSISNATFLFSGDTVIHKDFWRSKMLQRSFFWYILASKLRSPFRPVYWMLISKGYKTYLMMRRNFTDSYPRFDVVTPEKFKTIIDGFYQLKFGKAYDPRSGLIIFETPHGAVKDSYAQTTLDAIQDPDVLYFLQSNPNFSNGAELACLAEIRFRDFLKHIPKYFIKIKNSKSSIKQTPVLKNKNITTKGIISTNNKTSHSNIRGDNVRSIP